MATPYTKTPAGVAALADRSSGLSPRLRSVLILVDGRRTATELCELCAGLGDAHGLLAQLADAGLIATTAAQPGAAAAPAGPDPAGTTAEAAPPARPLAQARQQAARQLTALLGPMGDEVALALERARSPQDYLVAARRAEAVVRNLRGAAAAQTFHAQWVAIRLS